MLRGEASTFGQRSIMINNHLLLIFGELFPNRLGRKISECWVWMILGSGSGTMSSSRVQEAHCRHSFAELLDCHQRIGFGVHPHHWAQRSVHLYVASCFLFWLLDQDEKQHLLTSQNRTCMRWVLLSQAVLGGHYL